MADGSLLFDTKLDSTGFTGGLSKIASTAKTALKVVSTAMIGASAYAIKVGSDFEEGMSTVAAISGATGEELEALTEKAKEMGAKTKFSATESAEAFQYMAMAGWKTGDMLSGIEGIMNLAAASGENLGEVSDIVTDALTAFGLSASDSAHFADVLAQASSNANTNVSMMGQTFKYVAPVAGALGFSAEDCALAIGLMANSGIKAGQAGTSLRSILSRMSAPTNDVQEAMDALGISLTNSDGSMKSLREIMGDLRSSFSNLSEAQKTQMASTIGGQEAMSGLLAIVNASDSDFEKLADAIDHSDGAAERMAKTMNDNLKGKITIMQSALEGLGISVYEKFETPMKKAVESVTKNIDKLNSSMNGGKLSKSFDKVATSLANVASTAINLAIKALPKVIDAFAFTVDHAKELASGLVGAYTAFKVLTNYQKIAATVAKASATAQLLYETATAALTGQIGLATAAQEAFNLAMMATPAGLLAAAVAGIGVALVTYTAASIASYKETDKNTIATDKLVESSEKLTKTLKENKQARSESVDSVAEETAKSEVLTDRLEELANKTEKTAAEKQELKNIVDQLNESIPNLNLQYNEETDTLNKDTDAIRANIEAQKDQMLVKAYQEQQQSIVNDLAKAKTQLSKAEEQEKTNSEALTAAKKKTNKAYQEMIKAGKDVTDTTSKETKAYLDATLAQTKAQTAYKKSHDTVADLQRQISSLNKEYKETGKSVEQALKDVDIDNALADLTQQCAEAGVEIPKSVAKGIKSGKYEIPQSVEEMQALIKLDKIDSLQATLKKKGIKIPESLAEGIKSGNISADDAINQLTDLLNNHNYDKVMAKAKKKGVEIPTEMAEGIKNGSVTVKEANEYIASQVEFNSLLEKAQKSGYDVPQYISDAISSGSMKPKEAVDLMNGFIEFSQLEEKASKAGYDVPDRIAQAVNEGSMKPAEAVEWMNSYIEFNDLIQEANEVGASIPADLAAKVTEGQMSPAEAVQQMKNLIQFQDLLNNSTLAGTAVTENIRNAVISDQMAPAQAVALMKKNAVNAAQMSSEMRSEGTKGASGYTKGVGSGKGEAKNSGESLKDSAKTGASGGATGMKTEGVNAGNGFAAGISSTIKSVASAAASLVTSAINAAKKAQNSHSPSRKWRDEVGKMSGEGYIVGLKSTTKDAQKTAKEFIEDTYDAAKSIKDKVDFNWGFDSNGIDAIQSLRNSAFTVTSGFQKAAQSYTGAFNTNGNTVSNVTNYNMNQTNIGNGPIKPSENARELKNMARQLKWEDNK